MLLKIITVLFILISFIHTGNTKEIEEYKIELLTIGELDQKIRNEYTYWDDAIRIDKENLAKLKSLIKKYGFPTIPLVGKKAHQAAFLIAQHAASDKKFMLYFLNEMESRLGSMEITDQYYAYLLDRTNLMSDLKQIYGTQGNCINGIYEVTNIKDPIKLPQLRKEIGLLTLTEFSKAVCVE